MATPGGVAHHDHQRRLRCSLNHDIIIINETENEFLYNFQPLLFEK